MTVPSDLLKHRGLGPSNTFSVMCASRDNEELVDRPSQPEPGLQQLRFESEHAQSLLRRHCMLQAHCQLKRTPVRSCGDAHQCLHAGTMRSW